jgi:hypothetical protein
MSLDFDADDMPTGYTSAWADVETVGLFRVRKPGRGGRPRVHVNRQVAFYVRLGPTADWRENRRRYWRARRAR